MSHSILAGMEEDEPERLIIRAKVDAQILSRNESLDRGVESPEGSGEMNAKLSVGVMAASLRRGLCILPQDLPPRDEETIRELGRDYEHRVGCLRDRMGQGGISVHSMRVSVSTR